MSRKPKRKLTISEILNRDHYRAILYLTLQFGRIKKLENGFRQEHYRYALIKNHDGINPDTPLGREMELTFGKSLELGGYRHYWIRKCITTRQNLSNFLDYLVKRGLLTKRKDEHGINRYQLTDEGKLAVLRYFVIRELNKAKEKDIEIILMFLTEPDFSDPVLKELFPSLKERIYSTFEQWKKETEQKLEQWEKEIRQTKE